MGGFSGFVATGGHHRRRRRAPTPARPYSISERLEFAGLVFELRVGDAAPGAGARPWSEAGAEQESLLADTTDKPAEPVPEEGGVRLVGFARQASSFHSSNGLEQNGQVFGIQQQFGRRSGR